MQFVDAVNRILRKNGVLRGDTDPITNFSNLQHGTTMNVAQIAVQDAISDLIIEEILPPTRHASAVITLVAVQRVYTLATDFQRFWDEPAFFYDPVGNYNVFMYPGGEKQLRLDIPDYNIPGAQSGYPNWYYSVDAAVPSVGFFQEPNAAAAGRQLKYDYQAQTMPRTYSDVLPFQSDPQAYAFVEMASIRYALMMANDPTTGTRVSEVTDFGRLPRYVAAMAKVIQLINPTQPSQRYGHMYLSPSE